MRWFGRSWFAPVCQGEHVATPIGEACTVCGVPFVKGDRGVVMPLMGAPEGPKDVAYHRACLMDSLGLTVK